MLTLLSDRSAALNKQRIKKMTQRNKYVEESIKECKIQIAKYFENNEKTYKEMVHKLIVQVRACCVTCAQGLIKLMEPEVYIVCRESDKEIVESVLKAAVSDYKQLMKDNVKMLQGREPPLNLIIDDKRTLPEYSKDDENSW